MSDADYVAKLKARRQSILDELASMPNKPNYSKGDQSVSWDSHRKSLIDEVRQINQMLAEAEPFEIHSRGY